MILTCFGQSGTAGFAEAIVYSKSHMHVCICAIDMHGGLRAGHMSMVCKTWAPPSPPIAFADPSSRTTNH